MSSPPSEIVPASGRSKPAIIRSVVVFPEPDGPSSGKNPPSAPRRSTPSTATTLPNTFRPPTTWTSAGKRRLQDVEAAVELLVGDHERDVPPDHVAVEAAGE